MVSYISTSSQLTIVGFRAAKGCCQAGNDLSNQPVQVGVSWALNVQIPAANVVKCFVVVHDCHICVFQQRVHAQHLQAIIPRKGKKHMLVYVSKYYCVLCGNILLCKKIVFGQSKCDKKCNNNNLKKTATFSTRGSIVRLDNCCGHLWATPDREGNLTLLPIVHRQAFQHEAPQARSGATAASVVHTETLQSSNVLSFEQQPCTLWLLNTNPSKFKTKQPFDNKQN